MSNREVRPMEKHGEIRSDTTPPELEEGEKQAAEDTDLEQHVTKRAADAAARRLDLNSDRHTS